MAAKPGGQSPSRVESKAAFRTIAHNINNEYVNVAALRAKSTEKKRVYRGGSVRVYMCVRVREKGGVGG